MLGVASRQPLLGLALLALLHAACDGGTAPPEAPEQAAALEQRAAPLAGEVDDPHLFTAPGTVPGEETTAATSRWYRLTVPAGHSGLRVAVRATANVDVRIRRDGPTTSAIASANDRRLHTFFFTEAQTTADDAWWIEVHADADATVDVGAEPTYARALTWDDGDSLAGAAAFSRPAGAFGDHLFVITARAPRYGVWRNVLRVSAGEADLFLAHNAFPTDWVGQASQQAGSDAYLLYHNEFTESQTWFVRVRANTGDANWTLVSGDIHVADFGPLAATGAARALPLDVGVAWFRTEATADTLAWRLRAPGATFHIAKTLAPVPRVPSTANLRYTNEGLVVPDYLVAGGYLVAVTADAASVDVDSRDHAVIDPATLPGGDAFDFEVSAGDSDGFGYVTYKVEVPVQQIAWQVTATPTAGDVDVYVARGRVPSELDNEGFSESAGVADSVTFVPPSLTNGTFYVTVKGQAPFSFTLRSGNPVITPMAFVDTKPNGAAFEGRNGWRYYIISDIESQVGALGWALDLSNHVEGTEIALRRNAVPGRRRYRDWNYYGSTWVGTVDNVDASSTRGFLERPNHPADIWYIGIHQPTAALGPFTLTTSTMTATDLPFDGGEIAVSAQPSGRWRYFKVTVPTTTLGWDLQLDAVAGGRPKMVIRAEQVPGAFGDVPSCCPPIYGQDAWQSGWQWSPYSDMTRRPNVWVSDTVQIDESGRRLFTGMTNPLRAGVFYVGVSDLWNTNATEPLTYRIRSRGVGTSNGISVTDLAFEGGEVTVEGAAPREVRVYRVSVPEGAASLGFELLPSQGDAMLALRKGNVPSMEAGQWYTSADSATGRTGARRQRNGHEFYYRYPDYNQSELTGGDWYLVVGAEGAVTSQDSYVRGGTTNYVLKSLGELPVLGGDTLDPDAPTTFANETLRYGEQRAYRFTVPEGVASVEVALSRRAGRPIMSITRDGPFPTPSQSYYAAEGGHSPIATDDDIITIPGASGTYTILVSAHSVSTQPTEVGADYDLVITPLADAVIAFNGGTAVVEAQATQTWRYFRVDVPADALGWDLRIRNIQSGRPRLVVRRDELPSTISTNPSCCPNLANQDRWDSGWQWAPAGEYTQRNYAFYDPSGGGGGADESGRALVAGLGAPLQAGSYVIGVSDTWSGTSGEAMSYELVSRGIGVGEDGTGVPFSLQVEPLAFDGGEVTASRAPREAAFYRVDVPEGATSWGLELSASEGQAMMAARRGALPNAEAGSWYNTLEQGAGVVRRHVGDDFIYRYPDSGQSVIQAGAHYIAVAAEGQGAYSSGSYIGQGQTTFTLKSIGEVPVAEAAEPLGPDGLRWSGQSARYGEQRIYRFEVPAGVTSMELRLENRVGNPVLTVGGPAIPAPSQYLATALGGQGAVATTNNVTTLAEPLGTYTVVVTTHHANPGGTVGAEWDLVVTPVGETALAFNGGEVAVEAQPIGTWKYFRVNVPEGAAGWDLRLRDVTAGRPRMVIRRDELPESVSTNPSCCPPLSGQGRWNAGWQWAPQGELTGRNYSAYDPQTGQGGQDESGRAVVMGLGTPLEPGTYIVGVTDVSYLGTAPMSYRIVSRGIGAGDDAMGTPWAIQVRALEMGAVGEIVDLAPREHVFYRIEIPEGLESWSLELETIVGEAMMAVREGGLPNSEASSYNSDEATWRMGTRRQKSGREFFYKVPWYDTRPKRSNVYWVAVGSEGQNPYSTGSYIGTGPISARLHAKGPIPVEGGPEIVVEDAPYTFEGQRLAWGEHRYYRVRVPPTVPAFEVRLGNRVGTPYAGVLVDPYLETRFPNSTNYSYYAAEGGAYTPFGNDIAVAVPDETGDVTIVVHAQGGSQVENGYDLVITPLPVGPLAWDGGDETIILKDREVAYFRVEVPADCDEVAQAGWIVTQELVRGQAAIEVRKDNLPGAATGGQTLVTQARQTVIVPPYLSPGTWYVAVRATGNTELRLRTAEVRAERHFTMPARGEVASTPGLTHPFFADTGIDDAGQPIVNPGSGDQGTDLGQGLYRFYRLTVPPGNGGLFRTRLEAISGDPELFIRRGAAPTLTQMPGFWYINHVDYEDRRDGSSYGHWVPNDTRYGEALPPGDYWIAVYAEGSNVRYRLSLDVGVVTEVAADGGSVTGHALAAGDMRFYRVQLPDTSTTAGAGTPTAWTVNLTQQSGDALVLFREEVPPGLWQSVPTPSSPDYYLRDMSGDRSSWTYGLSTFPTLDATGPLTLPSTWLRPGATYWMGVYARTDTVYDLASSIAADTVPLAGVLGFSGDTLETTLAAGATALYRIDAPADAARWLHTATVATGVRLDLHARYLPPPGGTYSDWTNSGYGGTSANLDRNLDAPGGYLWNLPWEPGVSYYLRVTNTTDVAQAVSIVFDGRAWDDDSDNDGLPDGWEYKYYGGLYYNGEADSDGDFLTAAEELAYGTDPTNRDTDGDLLEDGAEAMAGANPVIADTDSDGVCDGVDSAPDDPNEAGPVIRLVMHRWEGGSYGEGYGTGAHRTRLVAVFDRSAVEDHWVHITGYDIESPDEVAVLLNGVPVGFLPVGGDGVTSRPTLFSFPTDELLPQGRLNRLELRQKTAGEPWGVTELGLFTWGERFGFDPTRAYDTLHPDGFDVILPELEDSWFELQAFDLEADDDVTVAIGGVPLMAGLPHGGDGAWTDHWQVPVIAAAHGDGEGPRVLSVRPRAGTDGAFQVRLVAKRPLLTTFGTEVNRGEGDHLTRAVRFLMPEGDGVRQLRVRTRISDGEAIALSGSAAEAELVSGTNYWAWMDPRNFFSLAGSEDTVTLARAPSDPPASYVVFVVNVLYYGPCADLDGSGVPDCEEICEDLDEDGVFAASELCGTGNDCDDADPDVGASEGDADCDGVDVADDCDDADPLAGSRVGDLDCDGIGTDDDCDDADADVGSNAGDADCDGVGTAEDCDDADAGLGAVALDMDCDGVLGAVDCDDDDAAVTATSDGDADCDGVPTADDCDDADAAVGAVAGDADCDGVPTADDCDDTRPDITTTRDGDADCDGTPDGLDCAPNDAGNTTSTAVDADCDGVPDAIDCAPLDAGQTVSTLEDGDCDGVPTALDCDDGDPEVRTRPDANDRDCDGLPTPIDCNDNDRDDIRTRVGDADCDGVATGLDCDDEEPGDTRVNTDDFDCDGVATADDCDDRDPGNTRSRVGDADCDGSPTGDDCDDNDPTVQACPVCLDTDEDGHDARTAECPQGLDCDDSDPESTTRDVDADCDGVVADEDCDDEDAEATVVAEDADCDTVPTEDDCDDEDPLLGGRAEDMDCDGVPDAEDNCAADFNPDQADEDLDGLGDVCEDCPGPDSDGDFVPDVCDVCPDVLDDQTDSVGDGVGDACRDRDDDGVFDRDDNCPDVANADQADADRDGKGDVCDDDPPVVTSGEDAGCQTGAPWPAALLVLGLVGLLARRRGRDALG